MIFSFYFNKSGNNTINKVLEFVGSVELILRGGVNLSEFSIKLSHVDFDIASANYSKAGGNCYFIDSIDTRGGVSTINLSLDVLETYRSDILANTAVVRKEIEAGDYGEVQLAYTGEEVITQHYSDVEIEESDGAILSIVRWG